MYMLMRDEGRKKEASKAIQTTKQSNTSKAKMTSLGCRMHMLYCIMYIYVYMFLNEI